MNEQPERIPSGKKRISQLGVLDLRSVKSIEELLHIEEISDIGIILMSDEFEDSLASIPMSRIGAVVTVPAGSRVNRIDGTMRIGGAFLEQPAADGADILLVAGELLITSPFQSVAYKQVITAGHLFIPRQSEAVLAPHVTQNSGLIVSYDHRNPRLYIGQGQFGKLFFDMMEEPVALILIGEFLFESDVTPDLLREKLAEMIVLGMIKTADEKLAPALQALVALQQGAILPAFGPGDGRYGGFGQV